MNTARVALALVTVAALVVLAFLVAFSSGCAPSFVGAGGRGKAQPFWVHVHNTSAKTLHVRLGVSSDNFAGLASSRDVAPHATADWAFAGGTPDYVELKDAPQFYDQAYVKGLDFADHAASVSIDYP